MVTFSNFNVGSILCFCFVTSLHILQRYFQWEPDLTVLTEIDGSCRTRRFLQNSTVIAGLDRFCRFVTILAATTPHSFRPTRILELLKYYHLKLQLRISCQWFIRKTLLNTQHLNSMNIYLYTPIPIFANKIWPCYLR